MKTNRISSLYSRPPYSNLGPVELLEPIFSMALDQQAENTPDISSWQEKRTSLLQRWQTVLGMPDYGAFKQTKEIIDQLEQPGYSGTIFSQATSPDTQQKLLLMEPQLVNLSPRPGMVIPFYDPDRMAGLDLKTQQPIAATPHIQFGRHLVQQGYVVVCTEAFPYNTVPVPENNVGFAWWEQATEKLLAENPNWTGIAKLAWDTSLALDLLLEQPNLAPEQIGLMGHSLGGKMAFYTAAFDQRVKAIVGSDFGLGFGFTNWDAPWYLGNQITSPDFNLAHHQLLALYAPRPFFLIGGEADRPASWQYIIEAQKVYDLYGKKEAIGFLDHASGHRPTEKSLVTAYQWLAEQFDLEPQSWKL